MKKFLFGALLFMLLCSHAEAQYFSTGQDPASIRWRQINTEHFQLIYPEDYEQKAQQLTYVFERVYEYGGKTLNHKPRKISVILHTHTIKSNGLVAWAPKRVELFTTPHQRIYAEDWLEELAVHEFRHVVQMDKIQSELPKLLPILFGEQAAAAVVAAYLPFWFIEGDAVITETALTKSGRGRLPSFLMENKAQVVEKGLFSYDKASLGSYKDYVPNRYHFGYWMSGAIREKYGEQIWTDVLEEIARKPLSVSPFNRVLKKYSGMNKVKLYKSLFNEYKEQWQTEIDSIPQTNHQPINQNHRFYTNYKYNSILSDGSIVSLKESTADIDRIVSLKDGEEKVLFTPGVIFQESFSARGNLLIWSERMPDPRWSHADDAVIVVYNTNTKEKRRFHFGDKLFSPVISPDMKKFVAVETDRNNNYFLSVFDLTSGRRLQRFSTADNQYFFTPSWDDDGLHIYYVSLSEKGKQLGVINLANGDFKTLFPAGFYEIRNPYYFSGSVYFTASFSGIENIYSINPDDLKVKQITSVRFGADYPVVEDDNKLIFSNYNSDGYGLSELNLKDGLNTDFDTKNIKGYSLAESLALHEDTILSFSGKEESSFPSKKYSKASGLFNFHSWAPANVDVDDYTIQPGVSFLSQNKLGTAETQLGYLYNTSEDAGKFKLNFKYSGFYPILETELSYGKRSSNYLSIINTVNRQGDVIDSDTTIQRFYWKELDWNAYLTLPLYFSHGKYNSLIYPRIAYTYRKVMHDETTPESYYEGSYQSVAYQLYLQHMLLKSDLDVYPDWGQTIEFYYRHDPFDSKSAGSLFGAQSNLFFPGLMKNHGLKFYSGYQNRKTNGTINYSDLIHYPRGTNSFHNNEMYSFSVDYALPLAYPDFHLGPLAFIKRIRANLFYDYAHLAGNIYDEEGVVKATFSGVKESLGLELLGDGHLLRTVAPISTGFRTIYLPAEKQFGFEFLFSVSFDSI